MWNVSTLTSCCSYLLCYVHHKGNSVDARSSSLYNLLFERYGPKILLATYDSTVLSWLVGSLPLVAAECRYSSTNTESPFCKCNAYQWGKFYTLNHFIIIIMSFLIRWWSTTTTNKLVQRNYFCATPQLTALQTGTHLFLEYSTRTYNFGVGGS